jgi:hypothetical protein
LWQNYKLGAWASLLVDSNFDNQTIQDVFDDQHDFTQMLGTTAYVK